ncbi:CGNR zinc finger domain-containing protein [Saccharothrix variisporea]|uniref:Putative RNA-binding Zn ribbon-like protein n=1 Tax=Saccharothrix variisporea TaxID=543527 RepID=A0A495XKE6_9PSEU|nr:ABATE domain-containing protein [Saccharothrix variisporea]RKT74587.1 putative RNA-binding Zn ribbon-like protein [Saccharothrix variisporea]
MDHFALVLPEEPTAVRLLNTRWWDRGRVRDGLAEPDHLRRWVAAVRPEVPVRDGDLAAFRGLRDALHALAGHALGDDIAVEEPLAVVNAVVADAPSRLEYVLTPTGVARRTRRDATPVEGLLADIAEELLELLIDGSLARCQAHGCRHFYAQKPRHRQWCSAKCGNRVRVARHYQRRREDT